MTKSLKGFKKNQVFLITKHRLMLFFSISLFWDRVALYSTGSPGTCSQTRLVLNSEMSASRVLGKRSSTAILLGLRFLKKSNLEFPETSLANQMRTPNYNDLQGHNNLQRYNKLQGHHHDKSEDETSTQQQLTTINITPFN